MFEKLTKYSRILVTGPQRSGTTIAAKMIAKDTGYKYIDEFDFGTKDEKGFLSTLTNCKNLVIQCPAMSHLVHKVANDDTLVVMMMRDINDIVASEKRVNWSGGPYAELEKFGMTGKRARSFRQHGGKISELKYKRWNEEQKNKIPNYLELEYESLSKHPLWVPKEKRVNFHPKQTTLQNES